MFLVGIGGIILPIFVGKTHRSLSGDKDNDRLLTEIMFNFFHKKQDNKLFYHTDVHCHLMPGVDHGAQTVDESLRLIERQMAMGIERIMLTSHVTDTTFENTPETLKEGFDILKAAVDEKGIKIELAYSAEYRMDEYWLKQREEGKLVPLPGKRLLLENSFQQELLMLDDIMFNLQLEGFRPIMAHPERYPYYSNRRERYRTLHNGGVKFQLNLLSLAGYYGFGPRETAEWLIDNDMCDYLGSDMHGDVHADVIEKYIGTKDYRKIAKKLEGRLLNDKM